MARYEFPASHEQRRMWVLDRLDPGRPTYNVPWAVWLDGPLDTAALATAWAAAVARHEALRTTFRAEGGVPVQVVDDDSAAMALQILTMEVAPQEAPAHARALLGELARASLDLAEGPLVRAHLIRLAPDRHVLSLVAHHIVADGWSLRLLYGELADDYAALLAGRQAQAAGPGLQYPDFALWQAEHDEAGGYAEAEAFWHTELQGAPHELALPVDRPYPDRERDQADVVGVRLSPATSAALRQLAADLGVTVFAVVAAGYAALLARLSGAEDLLIAVPVAARTRAEVEPVVGLFVNTLVIRADLRGDPTLGQLARRVHTANARAQQHQELPFARVVELTRPQRRPSRSPLVQVMCALEEAWPTRHTGGLAWRPEVVENGTGKFELELTLADEQAALAGRLRYRSDLFEPATASRHAEALSMVFAAMAADPGTRLSEVDTLPPQVRELVTRIWPAGQASARAAGQPAGADPNGPEPHAGPSLAQLVAAACAGDRVVVAGSDGELTGAQLGERAAAIAAGLSALGARVQDVVGILLPRGARMLAAMLGAWWGGTAYVAIDPVQPPLRIKDMLADAGVRVLITDRSALGSLLAEVGAEVAMLDLAAWPQLAGTPAGASASVASVSCEPGAAACGGQAGAGAPPADAVRSPAATPAWLPPEAAAYVLFTSGSTGRPKAVAVTCGSLAWFLSAFAAIVPLGPADRIAAVASFGFDISILELLLPLLAGAQVTVVDADAARDGSALRRLLLATRTTMLQATPTTWRMLTDSGGVPDQVRLRLCGGEALPRDLADALAAGTGTQLWNVYGPTETTLWSTSGSVAQGPAPVDVGTTIAGSRIYVLDKWANPVPPGATGEVHIGGAGVARGYVGAPGLTAARFAPDPFADLPGSRLYRTGDLGRWLPSGRLEILGRTDRQLKIRGFRVEAGEIEAALRAHADVLDAVVIALAGDGPGDLRLIAYVVTSDPDPAMTLRGHLRRLLPDYMIPWAFVPLAELPKNANGKVDHRALPQPGANAAVVKGIAPRTPLEAELADLIASVLRRPGPVGALDNFFVLGGHSLTATQVMAQIWTSYGVDLPVRTLFDDPTVAGLAAAVSSATADRTLADQAGPGLAGADAADQFAAGGSWSSGSGVSLGGAVAPLGSTAGGSGGSSPLASTAGGSGDLADFLDALSDEEIEDLLRPGGA